MLRTPTTENFPVEYALYPGDQHTTTFTTSEPLLDHKAPKARPETPRLVVGSVDVLSEQEHTSDSARFPLPMRHGHTHVQQHVVPLFERRTQRKKFELKLNLDTGVTSDGLNDTSPGKLTPTGMHTQDPKMTMDTSTITANRLSIHTPQFDALCCSPLAASFQPDHVKELTTQMDELLRSEETFLEQLELLRNAYWHPLVCRYPAPVGQAGSSVSSVNWSSSSESEGDEDEDENDDASICTAHPDHLDAISSGHSTETSSVRTLHSPSLTASTDSIQDVAMDHVTTRIPNTVSSSKTSTATVTPILPRSSSLAHAQVAQKEKELKQERKALPKPSTANPSKAESGKSVWNVLSSWPRFGKSETEVAPVPAPEPKSTTNAFRKLSIFSSTPDPKPVPTPMIASQQGNTRDHSTSLLSTISAALSTKLNTNSNKQQENDIHLIKSSSTFAPSMRSRAPSVSSCTSCCRGRGCMHSHRLPVRVEDAIWPYESIPALLDGLFYHLPSLIKLHRGIVAALRHLAETQEVEPRDIALAFLEFNDAFDVYVDYASNYVRNLLALENLILTNPRFRRYVRYLHSNLIRQLSQAKPVEEQPNKHDNNYTLLKLLALPLERIWHYTSAFDQLRRYAVHTLPIGDRQTALGPIQEFLDTLDALDLRINTFQRQIERMNQIAELQRSIRRLPALLLNERQAILHEGKLFWRTDLGEHSSAESDATGEVNCPEEEAYCWLLRDRLLLARKQNDGRYLHRRTIYLTDCTVYGQSVATNQWRYSNQSTSAGEEQVLCVVTMEERIQLRFPERRGFERWRGQIRLALTALPRNRASGLISKRTSINSETSRQFTKPSLMRHPGTQSVSSLSSQESLPTWDSVHAGQYVETTRLIWT